ncbi:MAG: hypothetical protein K8J31_08165 [Anaerolineae bacterium]|nr:hypothetical protein [Anaerolineae bacterium]
MMDLFTLQTVGKIRHEELLHDAAERRRFVALRSQDGSAQRSLRTVRTLAGRSLIRIGRFLSQPVADTEPSADMKWKTS